MRTVTVGLAGSAFFAAVFLLLSGPLTAADWPQFRGPTGQGVSEDTGLPIQWSEKENVAWKVAIPGTGWSSPVIKDGQLWLTTATEEGRSLRAIRVDIESGEIVHNIEVFREEKPTKKHEKNSYATPTPILEDGRVYVHFGPQGTAALSDAGEILWKNQELSYVPGHGQGGTPELAGDLLVISCDGTDQQFVVALDKTTGKIRWRTLRKDAAMAFSTPLVIEQGSTRQVVSPGANRAVAYQLETGEELWSVSYKGFSNVPRPVFAHGLVYVASGFYNPVIYAVRPDGRGDVTESHVAWSTSRGVPLTSSPLVVGDEIYFVSDNGIASCLDAKTGRQHWRSRLTGAYSASPLYAGGHIYFQSEAGLTTVITPGKTFKSVAENQLDGRTFASPSPAGKAIFLRTETHLYRIEN
ncbi:MAG: PQQ-binding-like beta-propeller repeat protein [Acidobacteria bacterium]|nr:PQQ-binding-like beta-propeller repeat protein [Acidobacteriota bacterium]